MKLKSRAISLEHLKLPSSLCFLIFRKSSLLLNSLDLSASLSLSIFPTYSSFTPKLVLSNLLWFSSSFLPPESWKFSPAPRPSPDTEVSPGTMFIACLLLLLLLFRLIYCAYWHCRQLFLIWLNVGIRRVPREIKRNKGTRALIWSRRDRRV